MLGNINIEKVSTSATFNGGQIHWLFEPSDEIREQWERRITCALCFTKKFLLENDIKFPNVPYACYISPTFTETKALLFEITRGKFIMKTRFASAVANGALFAEQRTLPFMDVHEYIHLLVDAMKLGDSQGKKNINMHNQPMWFKEGLPQYVQGKKDDTDFFELARQIDYIPPIVLETMNKPTDNLWLEYGIMEYYIANGNHPGLSACASFLQFLIEKERLGLKKVWELSFFRGTLKDFYQEIERLCQSNLFNLLNNYLYYIDKPFLPKNQKTWQMPVAVARDFRGEFTYENKEYKVLENLL